MNRSRYRPVFLLALFWTLALLLLGSVVHATGSSLACPDWPTCFGTMMPEMTGGVFYEHLHRLWAGGLVLIWAAATFFAFRDRAPAWQRHAAAWGLALLLVQSVFGGLTVLYRLPDAVSTTHLGLAFLFLAIATILAVQGRPGPETPQAYGRAPLTSAPGWAAGLILLQSLVGAAVRHTDSGLACPDVPRCIGEWIPPLEQWPIALHFFHRVLAVLAFVVVVIVAARVLQHRETGRAARRLALLALALVVVQVALGVLSVTEGLAVVPVSLHTLGAAALLATLVALAEVDADPTRPS